LSINWYLGNGEKPDRIEPHPGISPVKKVSAPQKIDLLQPRVASLVKDVDKIYKDVEKRESQTSKQDKTFIVHAKTIMSKPVVTLHRDTTKFDAIQQIRRFHYHHFPIVDNQDKIVGIITDRDFLRDAPNLHHRQKSDDDNSDETTVAAIMSTKLLIVNEETCVHEIGRVMLHEKIKCVPVVDQENKVKGMITSSDMICCIIDHPEVDRMV
jgi:CBS-domain-containing membrane protein